MKCNVLHGCRHGFVHLCMAVGMDLYTSPNCLSPGPYEFLMANHILGRWPANMFCKINHIAGNATANSVDAHVAVGGCLPFPYLSLTIPLPLAYQMGNKM